ncbi:Alpha/Beta hydrolase protein [Mycena pura]|uniref:Dipeptidyl-peptidase V n=1 Tax=Mycena pura TaxID=153505 RepID=A0AAD6XVW8_9AGAR|nr:Alpha/Beta hydrolase protein [Mycena pura]
MRFPLSLGLSAVQTAFQLKNPAAHTSARASSSNFAFKEALDVFSPQNFIELGRPGTGVANEAGDLVLIPFTKYSFGDKQNNKSVFLASLESPVSLLQVPLHGEAFWLDSRTIGHAVEGRGNVLDLYALTINFESSSLSTEAPIFVGSFPTKTATKFLYSSGSLVFSDYVYADGNLSSTKEQDEVWQSRGSTAMVYNEANIRFWDTWKGPKSPSVFRVDLACDAGQKWKMDATFDNLLNSTGHSSDDFSVVGDSVLYTSSDPEIPESLSMRRDESHLPVYLVSMSDPGNPAQLTGKQGGMTQNPILNSEATKAAWIQTDLSKSYNISKIVVFDLIKKMHFTLGEQWDRSPESIAFSLDSDLLYITAEDHARVKIFALPIPPTPATSASSLDLPVDNIPIALTHKGAALGIQPLSGGRLLFSASSFVSTDDVFLIHGLNKFEKDLQTKQKSPEFEGKIQRLTHLTADALNGKQLDEGEEFWFKGALDKDVQGWLFKPKGWKPNDRKKWPVAMVIHGGPQSSIADKWSTRWNPNMFSQQGYFSIWMNPTGSTGFGGAFASAITRDWGGKPFVDMIAGFKYILESYPQIDPDRAVAAGASWGGYAVNWLQGHPEYGFNFKALVGHDGVFDTRYASYTSDVLTFWRGDFGGVPWGETAQGVHQKFSPANYVSKWSTPMLLIHGSKDYRLPETESIGAFNALQQLGIPSRLVIFPDENHCLQWHYEVFKWLDQFVGEHVGVANGSE